MDDSRVLSIKIVSVDHYITFPIKNLDLTQSDFRKSPIKQVPVIRIFGVTQNKKKICANVHGVFPYFYIPCAETNFEKIDQLTKELAQAIDKSINVSLGQSTSPTQHVFNISLVKGTPFYGFHPSEHQFLRIQLYNPNLLRRVSNLVQSGHLLGKQFQPHESHIPYILKFFIDYNLFGMSYLHVPLKMVSVRDPDDKSWNRKRSVSQIEVDFKAIFILNRLAAAEEDTNKAANPGIESIWEDERIRRSLIDSDGVPQLESMMSQGVRGEKVTESDTFFRTLLRDKLAEGIDETLNTEESSEEGPKKTFNLKNFLDASTYAAELTQSSDSTQTFPTPEASQTIEDLENQFLNISESVDVLEQHFLNISETVDDDTREQREVDAVRELLQGISDDGESISPPFVENPPEICENPAAESDSDDEMFNELNETVADMEVFSQYVAEDDLIPQLDGIDDGETPKPGPSRRPTSPHQISVKIEAPSPATSFQISLQQLADKLKLAPEVKMEISEEEVEDDDEDENMKSFYNQTMMADDFLSTDEEESAAMTEEVLNQTLGMKIEDDTECDEESSHQGGSDKFELFGGRQVVTPAMDPPDPTEVLQRLNEFKIPMQVNVSPFYSNPKDFTGKKEVGHNLLEVPGLRLGDLEDFHENSHLEKFRKEKFVENFGFAPKTSAAARDFMTVDGPVVVTTCQDPPSFHDAMNWLKSDVQETQPELESPVKEKREKTLRVLEIEDDLDSSFIPSTPQPATPESTEVVQSSQEKDEASLAEFMEDGLFRSFSARKNRRKAKKTFSKRFQEIMKAKVASVIEGEAGGSEVENSQKSEENSQEIRENSRKSQKFEENLKKSPTLRNYPSSAENSQEKNTNSQKSLEKNSETSSDHTFYQDLDSKSPASSDLTLDSSIFVHNANIPESSSFHNSCDLSGATLNNTYGFKMKLESLQSNAEHTDLTILAMELHTQTRGELKPNPEFDEISAIFFTLDAGDSRVSNGIIVNANQKNFKYINPTVEVIVVKSEMEIFETFFKKIRDWDPDIFAGYEIEMASWGYLVQRGLVLNMNLNNALSRMPLDKTEKERAPPIVDNEDKHDTGDYNTEQKIPGRIMLDVWRLMTSEIALTSYTFENVCYHVLHRRYPKHSFPHLTTLWRDQLKQWIVLDYYAERARTLIEILKQLDLIGRTCELAKLFGIQFYEVLSRGSQFRVESMMIRIAKRRNYVPVSPSVTQRAHMRAPEYIPLILEPESRFYSDPVIVLDFQSLYPSIIIGYNYCFSTCLGRVEHLMKASSQPFEFGAYQLRLSPSRIQKLLDDELITISPCGVAFVKSEVREGVLPRMLREILDTRLMVKQSMKIHKSNSALQRILHSRQLGLKLIANVTYGYTAANFSGRMPAIEVGDSVVSKGRETLERAIKMVEANKDWGCRVCYGDTDSMFVQVPGRSREEAFKIGEQIAEAVTNDNPHPVKLKLEKVYQPCILQTKKRYVGFMYESADQKDPVYEAKGIETVRRDGCPAASKILEKTLKILFETCDVSKVKEYVCRQFTKILAGRCSIQDLLFAREFRGLNGYKEKACVPALNLTRKWKLTDPRNEPRQGERVPFLIVNGAPGVPLFKLVRSPHEVLWDENYKINSIYYITKAIIPPLNRCLLLIGANVFDWFTELPRKHQFIPLIAPASAISSKKGTISQFFSTSTCVTCDKQCHQHICADCRQNSQQTVLKISEEIFELERKVCEIELICQSCCKRRFETDCVSLDCPVLYASVRAKRESRQMQFYREILDDF